MKIRSRLYTGFFAVTLILVLMGLLSIIATQKFGNLGFEIGQKQAPLVDAVMEIKLSATLAHLWLEEILSGDQKESIDEVWQILDQTTWYVNTILNGDENEEDLFIASKDAKLREVVERVGQKVNLFRYAAEERYKHLANSSGIGSDADQSFDKAYETIIADLNQAAAILERRGDIRSLRQIMEVKFLFADAHLFLEEFLSGDQAVKLDEILSQFRSGKNILSSLNRKLPALIPAIVEASNQLEITARSRAQNFSSNFYAGSVLDEEFDSSFETFIQEADSAEKIIHETMKSKLRELNFTRSLLFSAMAILLLSGVVLSVLFSLLISNKTALPLEKFQALFQKGADGDLTVRSSYAGRDEIGTLSKGFNHFMEKLQMIYQELKNNAGQLSEVGQDLESNAQGANEISNHIGAEIVNSRQLLDMQSSNISETSTSIEQVVRNIESLEQTVIDQSASVTQSSASIEEMIASISNLSENTGQSIERITELVNKTKTGQQKMSDVTTVVQKVASLSDHLNEANKVVANISAQTNLLAMNAAIEAAHAGETGRGFSVVADEIRKLAVESAAQSKDVAKSLKEVMFAIDQVVKSTGDTAQVLKEVGLAVGDFSEIFTALNIALTEQRESGQSVLQELKRMNEMTQTVKEGTSEMSSGNKEIMRAVQQLQEVSVYFSDSFGSIENQKDSIIQSIQGINQSSRTTKASVDLVEKILNNLQLEEESGKETVTRETANAANDNDEIINENTGEKMISLDEE